MVEPPALPIANVLADPRRLAVAAVSEALEELGVRTAHQTLLVACGLARRASRGEIAALVTPELRRRFHGRVAVHDAADPALVGIPPGAPRVRVAPELVETDLVVVVSAAETVLHGGPATLLAAADAETQRRATAESLLETGGSEGWRLATLVEQTLAGGVPLLGVSLVLNHPQFAGLLRGYPYEPEAAERIARSPLRHAFSASPDRFAAASSARCAAPGAAAAVLAGPPSVAHAEALLRAIELRRATLDEPLDALVIGIPGTTPFLPREPPNPLLAAHLGLAHALGLWRDAFPVRDGGIVILVHGFRRIFARPTQQPYHVFFRSDPIARNPELLARRGGCGRRGRARASRSTAPGAPSIRCCRSATGRPAGLRSSGSAPSTSRALATATRCDSSASSRSAGSARRSRWPAATAVPMPASASCSRRRTSRSASAQAKRRPRTARRTMAAQAEVAELADAPDSKSGGLRAVWVRFPPSALGLRGTRPRAPHSDVTEMSWATPRAV